MPSVGQRRAANIHRNQKRIKSEIKAKSKTGAGCRVAHGPRATGSRPLPRVFQNPILPTCIINGLGGRGSVGLAGAGGESGEGNRYRGSGPKPGTGAVPWLGKVQRVRVQRGEELVFTQRFHVAMAAAWCGAASLAPVVPWLLRLLSIFLSKVFVRFLLFILLCCFSVPNADHSQLHYMVALCGKREEQRLKDKRKGGGKGGRKRGECPFFFFSCLTCSSLSSSTSSQTRVFLP